MSEIGKGTTGIIRYTKADAEELCAQIEARRIVGLVIRTELFNYARVLGVMIAYADRPGYEDIRFSGRQFDAIGMAEEILAGVQSHP